MSRSYTCDNLISTFPYVLSEDKKQSALAHATAEELSRLYEQNRLAEIYNRIDELDEELCDVLAYDYKIDWYMWTATVEAKRALIKSHFEVHRHLGTKGAVKTALSSVCPGTYIEEWFEYSGKPYYFRIILDATEQKTAIRQSEIERMLKIFKSVRSILETDKLTLRSRCTVAVSCEGKYALYSTTMSGTYPHPAMQGRMYGENIIVSGIGESAGFSSQKSGRSYVGTSPAPAYRGSRSAHVITVTPEGVSYDYDIPLNGTVPVAAIKGSPQDNGIQLQSTGDSTAFSAHYCGTPLGSIMKGGV